jgi:hypothetical protein
MVLSLLTAGCATAPLDPAGSLMSYADMKPSDRLFTHAQLNVSGDDVLAAKTARVVPTVFSDSAESAALTPAQRTLIANAVDRALCAGLSERFEMVGGLEPSDLIVRAEIIDVSPTDVVAAGLSKAASRAVSIALPGVPVPVPRLPIGLGSLSIEAEAIDREGNQRAAMIWARGANVLFDSGRVAREGDAYELAAKFAGDFSELLVTGKTPFGGPPSLPSARAVGTLFGTAPTDPACDEFGKSPGLAGKVGSSLGLPPRWTDGGAAPHRD